MIYEIIRTDEEINHILNLCDEATDSDESTYVATTRAEAIRDAIFWLTTPDYDNPME